MGELTPLRRRLERHLLDAAHDVAQQILEEAIANAPVGDPAEDPDPKTALAKAGKVEVELTPTGVVATISFDTDYALKQHEDLRLRHPRGGGGKFLERAITSHYDNFRRAGARAIERATR